jgi:hypothetical protein
MTRGALMTPLLIRRVIVGNAKAWSVAFDHHTDDRNIFIIQTTRLSAYTSGLYYKNILSSYDYNSE